MTKTELKDAKLQKPKKQKKTLLERKDAFSKACKPHMQVKMSA